MRRVAATALLALGLAGLAGCSSGGGQAASGVIAAQPAPSVRLVDCEAWRGSDPKERASIVSALTRFAGGPSGSPGGHGRTLESSDAHRLFNSYCRERFARGFKLYKLYTRAAAFSGR